MQGCALNGSMVAQASAPFALFAPLGQMKNNYYSYYPCYPILVINVAKKHFQLPFNKP